MATEAIVDADVLAATDSGWAPRHLLFLEELGRHEPLHIWLVGSQSGIDRSRSILTERGNPAHIEHVVRETVTNVPKWRRVTGSLPAACTARCDHRCRHQIHLVGNRVWVFLPWLSHLALAAAPGSAVIAVLEERWEKALPWPSRASRWLEVHRFERLYRRLARAVHPLVVAINDHEAADLAGPFGSERVITVAHAVAGPALLRERTVEELQHRPRRVLLLGPSSLDRNGVYAADVVRELTSSAPGHLPLVARVVSPSYASAVRALMGTPGVEFGDPTRPVAEHLDWADLLVVPAFEGSGTKSTVLESMAQGCPVVTTRLGVRGIVMPSSAESPSATVAELTKSALTLLSEPDALIECSRQSRAAWELSHSEAALRHRVRHLLQMIDESGHQQ